MSEWMMDRAILLSASYPLIFEKLSIAGVKCALALGKCSTVTVHQRAVYPVGCPLIVSVNAFSESSATIQQGSAAAGCNQAHYVRHKPTCQPTVEYEHADVSTAD
ncbi:hypothetical protein T09_12167 [Trichinella sp. T9]|nr:hypothetical protein T09_12167 [Trichinella sp. T9]